eukprot:NODE_10301_length_1362_cov_3.435628.p1 GENE.NODE_10301_length_1362_cov_3.435628~~NODE_10301_length_1362_cov_3.435628.p1  ORF type:complete len:358 (-),score=101.33 NODE_10301_length_1362_cov_3.435628:288-1262(-)
MPLEVVKTRIAVSQTGNATTIGTLREVMREEGLRGLFIGVGTKCSENGLKNFIFFYFYDLLLTMAKRRTAITTPVNIAVGYFAGVFTASSTMPLEVIGTVLQVDKELAGSFTAATRQILKKQGLKGFFNGFGFNMMLCINPAIQNTCFDKMKDALLRTQARSMERRGQKGKAALTPLTAFLLGALAKAMATLATYPLVRLKVMLQAGKKPAKKCPDEALTPVGARRRSTSDLLKALQLNPEQHHSHQGLLQRVTQLYRGLNAALWKSTLQAALLYATKDQIAGAVHAILGRMLDPVGVFSLFLMFFTQRQTRLSAASRRDMPLT